MVPPTFFTPYAFYQQLNFYGRFPAIYCYPLKSVIRKVSTETSVKWNPGWLDSKSETLGHRRRIKTEEKAKVVVAVWGTELILLLAAIGKRDDPPIHTIPNHHPNKTEALPKFLFLQIILAANWLVWHLSISPPTNSGDLCLLFCLYSYSMLLVQNIS